MGSEMCIRDSIDFVSPGAVDIVDDEIGIDKGVTIAGPFGHRMILVEETEGAAK